MQEIVYIALFSSFIGLFIGSFFNVVALRTLKDEGLSFPPSHCTSCNHKLSPLDLVPVLSYLFLGGKCRYCKEKISKIYPFGEILTSIAFGLIIYKYGLSIHGLLHISFISIMLIATISDLKEKIVPDKLVITGLSIVLAIRIIIVFIGQGSAWDEILIPIVASILSFGLLFFIFIFSMERMGGADVKLYALIGLAIGFSNAVASLFYASILSLVYHLPPILKGTWDREQEIPFVPFITVAVLITYFINVYNFIPV